MQTLIRKLEKAAMVVAGVCVIAIMLIVVYDAIGRYLFGSPLQWAFDVVSNFLMVGAAYLALSGTFQRGDHISIKLLHSNLSRPWRAGVDITCSLLAIALFGAIAYGTGTHALDAYRGKEFLPGVIMWPVWLSYLPIPIGTAILVLRLLHHCVTLLRQGEDSFVAAEGEGAVE
jgi:TRAP-type C4-dicarboxylate transport system permease small subunit